MSCLFYDPENFPLPICAAVFFSSMLPSKGLIPGGPPVKSLDTRPKHCRGFVQSGITARLDIAEKMTNDTEIENLLTIAFSGALNIFNPVRV
ncbi:hypothetical protein AVEN_82075-1 [Araneus ventricosus]|uniref:Uncharacterized protein n=1 Tax=Araneus ventricosus TaxID=182803 RepID=A0A4Y2N3H3_ARAVE|nr:hypothetical protein AVEN_82075-1 [Araneus ventricosus]